MKRFLPFVLILHGLISPRFVLAETPEEVVTAYFQQMRTGGIGTIASLMHPEELTKFRRMLQPIVEGGLASAEAATFSGFSEPNNPSRMRDLTDEEFMNEFMDTFLGQQPELTGIFKTATIQTLGHVVEEDVKHVVVRMKVNYREVEIEKLMVLSVKEYLGQPRMMLTGEMNGIANALKARR